MFVMGLLGTCCGRYLCKTYLALPVLYGVSLLGIWIITLALGVMITTVASGGPQVVQSFCDGVPIESQFELIVSEVETIDTKVIDDMNHYMCSELCPCNQAYAKPWLDLDEKELNKFNRTKV
jgi:hypothetical protein